MPLMKIAISTFMKDNQLMVYCGIVIEGVQKCEQEKLYNLQQYFIGLMQIYKMSTIICSRPLLKNDLIENVFLLNLRISLRILHEMLYKCILL